MKNKVKINRGITLIALVVTIIVLLILTGVSVTTVFNSEGLLYKVSQSANKSRIAQIIEELELLKTLVLPGTLDNYMETLLSQKEKYRISENDEENGIYNYEQIDEEHWIVVIEERYQFLIYTDKEIGTTARVSSRSGIGKSTSSNIIIEYQGEVNTGLLVLSEKKGDILYPTPKTITVIENTSGGKLSAFSSDESIASVVMEGNNVVITPKLIEGNQKRVKITVTSEAKGKYKKQIAKYTATIKREATTTGVITIIAEAYEGEFDGKLHPTLKNVTVEPTDAKVTYSLNGGEYQNTIPEVELVGEYTVTIRAEKEGYETHEITKTVTITGIHATVSFEPNGNITYKKEHATQITVQGKTKSIKYKWTDTNKEPIKTEFTLECSNGETIKNSGITGAYYLWVLLELETGEDVVCRSEAFNFDNNGPTVEINSNPISDTEIELTVKATDTETKVKQYNFYVDGNYIDKVETNEESIIYKLSNLTMGYHAIKVEVLDDLGNASKNEPEEHRTLMYAWDKYNVAQSSTYVPKKGNFITSYTEYPSATKFGRI